MVEKSFNEQWGEVIAKMPGTDGATRLPAAQELLPCPFCGGKAENRGGNFHVGFWITCGKCCVSIDPGKTEAESIALWNRRAPQAAAPGGVAPTPSLVEENKRLREALEKIRADTDDPFAVAEAEAALRNGEPG